MLLINKRNTDDDWLKSHPGSMSHIKIPPSVVFKFIKDQIQRIQDTVLLQTLFNILNQIDWPMLAITTHCLSLILNKHRYALARIIYNYSR